MLRWYGVSVWAHAPEAHFQSKQTTLKHTEERVRIAPSFHCLRFRLLQGLRARGMEHYARRGVTAALPGRDGFFSAVSFEANAARVVVTRWRSSKPDLNHIEPLRSSCSDSGWCPLACCPDWYFNQRSNADHIEPSRRGRLCPE
jgi:hypothetical protein